MEVHMKINGELVRVLREEKSWSQDHLASASGLSVRTIQRVEAEGVASAETRLALAAALGVPVSALMAGSSTVIGEATRSWRVPIWGWLGWGVATVGSIGAIAFGTPVEYVPLRLFALNLFPWLALLGLGLCVIAMIGRWQRSRASATREA